MRVSHLFVAPQARRLRSGWRLVLQFLLMSVLGIVLSPLAWLAMQALTPGRSQEEAATMLSQPSGAESLLVGLGLNLIVITASVFLARRFLDRRSFGSLGLARGRALPDLLFGFGLAAGMMAAIYAAESAFGWLRFEGWAWQTSAPSAVLSSTLLWLFVFVIVGWQEELLSRGYWLRNLTEGTNVPVAALLSALGFALLHLGNPNMSWTAVVGLLVAGVWFACAVLATRQLWLAIGAHIGWNFCEATVFGFSVSGLDAFGLIKQTSRGPVLWTGGPFGPEAGLIMLPALALGALAIWGYTRGRS